MSVTEDRPRSVAGPNNRATVTALAFWAGLSIPFSNMPQAMFEVSDRLGTVIRLGITLAPYALALVLVNDRERSLGGDRLSHLNLAWVISLSLSTVVSLGLSGHSKALTMIGGTLGLIVGYLGATKMAKFSGVNGVGSFVSGIQLGFLVFGIYMILSGNISRSGLGAGLITETFADIENVGRNTVTFIALIAFAGSLYGLASRRLARDQLFWDISTAALALYYVYIIPGKGAWFGAGLMLMAFLLVLLKRRAWHRFTGGIVLLLLAAPAVIERVYQYLVVYERSGAAFSLSGRLFLWQAALRTVSAAKAYLLGFGYDSAYEVSSKILPTKNLLHFHNEFINAYFDGGVIGLVLVSAVLFLAAWGAFRQNILDPNQRNESPSLFCYFVVVLVFSRVMTDVTLTTFTHAVPLWFYCCGLLSWPVKATRQKSVARAIGARGAPAQRM
jgi:O-antigen ligase